jgi:SAM-dependent methyltransferase
MTAGEVWDRRFREADWPSDPDPALVEFARILRPGRALDLGCGPGRNAIWLAGRGWDVTGVDASRVALEQADRRAKAAAVELRLICVDLDQWSPPVGSFDLVVLANLHPEPVRRRPMFSRAAAAVAPGGRLFVVGHHLDDLGLDGPSSPEQLFTEEDLRDAFPGIRMERVERVPRLRQGDRVGADVVGWGCRPTAPARPGSPTHGSD